MSKTTIIHNIPELEVFAEGFISKIQSGDKAVVVGLRGELGSGKTAFTKALAKNFDLELNITSPTFVILKKYPLSGQKFSNLIHIDAYRLKSGNELTVLGWETLLADKNNLIMIEWPEIVADVMPNGAVYLDFKHIDENTREIYEK